MTKKRRVFDINFDEAAPAEPAVPAGTDSARRGPMAAAITENAAALASRQQAEAAIRAENDALAHEHVRLKQAGLITDLIALDEIRTDKLTRDRAPGRDADIDDLKRSIVAVGLSNPIRVEKTEAGYELIQGYRRLTAYRELRAETGKPLYDRIPAGIDASGAQLLTLYRRMVDENLVRRGVSFGEMARLAMAYRAQDPNMDSYDAAVETLFASSGRQRRSYIKHFVRLLAEIGAHLDHPQAIPRALGLTLVKRLDDDPALAGRIAAALADLPGRSAETEVAALQAQLDRRRPDKSAVARKSARTSFRIARPEGMARCVAVDGRVDLRLDRDFSSLERHRLEAAVQAFFAALDD